MGVGVDDAVAVLHRGPPGRKLSILNRYVVAATRGEVIGVIETPVVERESSAATVSAGGPPRFFAIRTRRLVERCSPGRAGADIARAGLDADWAVVPIDLAGANVNVSRRTTTTALGRRLGPRRRAAIAGRRTDVGAGSVPTAWMFSPCSGAEAPSPPAPTPASPCAATASGSRPSTTARRGVPAGRRRRRRARRHRARGHLVGIDRRRRVQVASIDWPIYRAVRA